MSSDPLSFFGGDVTDSDSDQSEEAPPPADAPRAEDRVGGLPHPLAALSSATTPDFVTSHVHRGMNWDKWVKKAPYVAPKEFKPWENPLPAVESRPGVKSTKPDLALNKQVPRNLVAPETKPPGTVAEQRGGVTATTDFAISWSKMYKDSTGDRPKKRPLPQDEDKDLAGFCHTDVAADKVAFNKQSKTSKSFAAEEKRKRDCGQQNREKMFVEEEKRILRQNF